MFKLLSLVLLVSFLFASSLKEIKLIVNSKGNLTIVNQTVYSASKNVSFAPECTPVEANANSPPLA